MAKKEVKGPSLSALAALITLAVSLWMEVDLATALFRSVLVYLGLSMLSMAYRVVLGRFIAASQEKAERELLEKVQREAEEERRRRKESQVVSGDPPFKEGAPSTPSQHGEAGAKQPKPEPEQKQTEEVTADV